MTELRTIEAFGTDKEILELTVDWTCSTGGASTTSTADIAFMTQTVSDIITGRMLISGQTVPVDTPSADYDVVVNDANGEDVFGGRMVNRSNSLAETEFPGSDTVATILPVTGDLSVVVSNAGNAKSGQVILTFE